ncbi:alpha/beta fold hydrolase [Undibacterium sp. LX40W]|uniref:Alpha/beta fold hydrolase n=1 Tax=Undibacterium nitidum TaxID=2762298 RepID=A0A923HUK8_9BURK|nr:MULTISPECIES: alpha/beta hydrolase [Undibacterium]MBC3880376.1 alpha/beta fold hydrolase [Undibacterium nitidum]MBC3890887.1 alpha/beta fold hydrolase [Undibacterium sp. LX40W]
MKNLFALFLVAALNVISVSPTLAQGTEKMISVTNGQLHTLEAGDGPYTIIFEAGFMSDLSVWHKVAPAATKHGKIILYSRAGVGKSPARAQPLNLIQHTEELRQLIDTMQIKTPIILVGHSYGGWVVREFAAKYPKQIAGFVLVDPANETLEVELRKINPEKVAQDQKRLESMAPPVAKADLALVQKIFDEAKLPTNTAIPDMPMAILSSIQVARNNPFYQETAPALAIKRELHARFFAQFSNGVHVVTNQSGHHIQLDEPHLVIDAINLVVTNIEKETQKRERQIAKQKARQAMMLEIEKADALLNANKVQEASATLNEALKVSQLTESEINQLGFDMLEKAKKPLLAEIVLAYNVARFPQSDNAYDSYGEALLALNKFEEAKTQFEQALRLGKANPQRSPKALLGYEKNLKKAEQGLSKK